MPDIEFESWGDQAKAAPAGGDLQFEKWGTGKPSVYEATGAGGSQYVKGMPVVGNLVRKGAAAINAAVAPIFGEGGTYGERYAKELAQMKEAEAAYEQAHPVLSTAKQVLGGGAALAPIAATAPGAWALGASGSLPSAIVRGAASGTGLGLADAASGGEELAPAAVTSGLLGAAGPLAGKVLGKAAQAIANRNAPAVPPAFGGGEQDIAGVKIPIMGQQASGNVGDNVMVQAAKRGALGDAAEQEAKAAFAAQEAKTNEAKAAIAKSLDMTGTREEATPHEAAGLAQQAIMQHVGTETAAHEAAVAAHQAAIQDAANGVRSTLGAQPTAPLPTAQNAAGTIQRAIQEGSEQARTARNQAYTALRSTEGDFSPAAFNQVGTSVNSLLHADGVRINPEVSSYAAQALRYVQEDLGAGKMPVNRVTPPIQTQFDETTGGIKQIPGERAITLADVEEARKGLRSILDSAVGEAKASRNWNDVHNVRKVMDAFDTHVNNALRPGVFSGDAAAAQAAMQEARALHSAYRRTYTSQGSGDTVGQAIEKVIGRYADQEMPHGELGRMMYGPAGNVGSGQMPVKMAARLFEMFPEGSPERRAWRQGLIEHATANPEGNTQLPPAKVADRIGELLNGDGRQLAQNLLPEQRASLQRYSDALRVPAPERPIPDTVQKVMDRIAGRDGPPATLQEVAEWLIGNAEIGRKGMSVQLAQRLKQILSPNSEEFAALKQATFQQLVQPPSGVTDWGPQRMSQRIMRYLNGPGAEHAGVLFSPEERAVMKQFAGALKQMVPPEGAVNYSNSATVFKKIAGGSFRTLMTMLGAHTGGLPGAAAGLAIGKAGSMVKEAANARKVRAAIYAPKTAAPVPISPVAPLLSHIFAQHERNQ